MRRNYRQRPQKKRFFFGCEGKSEQAYGQLLNKLAQELQVPVYLDAKLLTPGAGNPLALVTRAIKRIKHKEKIRTSYSRRFILLDQDLAPVDSQIAKDTEALARNKNITLIWQIPCHEALLLRHLQGHVDKRPPNSDRAQKALLKAWPEYGKPMTGKKLSRRIRREEVRQAMSVEPELKAFLQIIGLV